MDIPKFGGRWPFTRVLGFHEVMSVLFSLLNLGENLRGGLKCSRRLARVLARHGPAGGPPWWLPGAAAALTDSTAHDSDHELRADRATERDLWRLWLWVPILLCSVVVWIASALYHTRPHYQDATEVIDVLSAASVPASASEAGRLRPSPSP